MIHIFSLLRLGETLFYHVVISLRVSLVPLTEDLKLCAVVLSQSASHDPERSEE